MKFHNSCGIERMIDMAVFNPIFPMNYQSYQMPYYSQPQQPQQSQQPMMTPPTIRAEIVQVDDEQTAANYPVAIGTPQMMISKDDKCIFVKTSYANGQYQLDVYEKRPSKAQKTAPDLSAYVTRDELEKRLSSLTKGHGGLSREESDE